ncbi:MAG: hypothetical protein CMJ47_08770 [Planctomyces sp.]|nr:hypothetical protein [Planctomyces sp.]
MMPEQFCQGLSVLLVKLIEGDCPSAHSRLGKPPQRDSVDVKLLTGPLFGSLDPFEFFLCHVRGTIEGIGH